MKRKIWGVASVLVLAISLASCNNSTEEDDTNTESSTEIISTEEPTESSTQTITEVPSTEESSVVTSTEESTTTEIIQGVWLSYDEGDYYAPLNGKVDGDFIVNLHKLLETTHTTRITYEQVWDLLKVADEDPNNSDNIICFYTGQSIPKSKQDKGGSGDFWNREHMWCQSKGLSSESAPAHNDGHHLHATGKSINSTRNNRDFNEVTNPTGSDTYGNKWDEQFFEPRDEVKGDVARCLFYMVARYDGDDCKDCKLDLSIVDHWVDTDDCISNQVGYIGVLSTLLKWHYQDPVSETERIRNEKVYNVQGNRNAFIDHPEYVDYLYTAYVGNYIDTSKLQYLIK